LAALFIVLGVMVSVGMMWETIPSAGVGEGFSFSCLPQRFTFAGEPAGTSWLAII